MNNKENELIYNDDYCVIVPEITSDLLKAFQSIFKNVFYVKNRIQEKEKQFQLLKNSLFKKIILVDYQDNYEDIIKELGEKTEIDFMYTGSMANFTYEFDYEIFKKTFKLFQDHNTKLGILDNGLYNALRVNHKNIYYVMLDINNTDTNTSTSTNNENTIGLLNDESLSVHSFYNELTAMKLLDNTTVNIKKCNQTTKKFLKDFAISYKQYNSLDEIMIESEINLYINFTKTNFTIFLQSMDLGIPCILGNTSLLDDNDYLKKMLVMESDDDVNEIATKVEKARKEKDKILKEYKKFRSNYRNLVKKYKEEFIEGKETLEQDKDYEKLLSVVVPVYNTEQYLKKSIESILKAAIDDMEILIINDGSTDNSEEIIKEFELKYPTIIRYIKKANGGLGSVRNVGLKEAKGKYIASVDSDDTIHKDFFKEAELYLKEDVDVVLCDWLSINEDHESFETPAIEWSLRNRGVYEALLYSSIMPSTCNKIMKKSILDALNLKYVEDKYEDLSLNPVVLLKAKTLKYIPRPYYEYYLRSGSLMRTSAGYSMIHIIKELNKRIDSIKDEVNVSIDEFKYYTYSWRIEEYIMNQLYTVKEEEIDDYIKKIYENVYDICNDIFDSNYYKKMLERPDNNNLKDYIEKRNKAFKNKKLKEFILNARKTNHFEKITPPTIYSGE